MAARETVTTPDLEAGNACEASLAHDSLQSNLNTSLTLSRKRSGWLGSTREALSRGTLQAKGFVDSLRGASPARLEERPQLGCEHIPIEHHGFSPKAAMRSFRQHVQMSGSKSRQQRGALADFYDNNAQSGSPKRPREERRLENGGSSPKGHGRKRSLGRNLVGSIRGMTAKHTRNSPGKPEKENCPPANIPLPPTPVPPPILTVDIGVGEDLVPETFGRVSYTGKELPALPKSIISESPKPSYNIDVLTIEKWEGPSIEQATTPITDEKIDTAADDSQSVDALEVFERSVDIKESKSLRRMVSLDAMAEQCTQHPDTSKTELQGSKRSPSQPQSPLHPSPASTIRSCPSDMEEISRQPAWRQSPTILLESQTDGMWRSDDPFAPGTPSIKLHGPDSELPFRPKSVPQKLTGEEVVAMEDLSSLDGHIFKSRSPAIVSSCSDQGTASPAQKHRSMVSEVLEIDEAEWETGLVEAINMDDSDGRASPFRSHKSDIDQISELWIHSNFGRADSVRSAGIDNAESDCPSNVADTSSPPPAGTRARQSTPAPSEEKESSDSALQRAISDNYYLQVALGGVDITCDDKLRAWLDKSDDEEEEEKLSAQSTSAARNHTYDVFPDDIDNDATESIDTSSVLETKSRKKEDSLDEALDMYRTYSAESEAEMVKRLLATVDISTSPTSPESTCSDVSAKRKPLPIRYRSLRGRQ